MDTTQQLPAVIEFDVKTLPATIAELLPTQKGWLGMEFTKRTTFEVLKNSELEIQGLINHVKTISVAGLPLDQMVAKHTEIKSKLAEAKNKYELLKGRRLWFTGYLTDNVITPAMQFEKRCLVLFEGGTLPDGTVTVGINSHELGARKVIETETNAQQYLLNEKAAYRAHIENEINRVKVTYISELEKLILDAYTLALQTKEPVTGIAKYKTALRQQLQAIKLSSFIPYPRIYLKDEGAQEIIADICKTHGVASPAELYKPGPDLHNAISKVAEQFGNYENDLANAKKAIEATQLRSQHLEQETKTTIEQDKAVNDITAKAGTFQILGTPGIKRKLEIIEEDTPGWAVAVMNNFIKLLPDIADKKGAKTWPKVTVGQMAVALGKYISETGEIIQGLNTREIEK